MGIFSETSASFEAKKYSELLYKALETKNKDIIDFSREHLFPKYKKAISEAYKGIDMNLFMLYYPVKD